MARRATGSILWEGDRWKARITFPDGTRKHVSLPKGYTEDQARAKAQELSELVRTRGIDVTERANTLAELAPRWLQLRKTNPELSPSTMRGDSYNVNSHILPALGDIPLLDLGPATLRGFVRDLRVKRANVTVRNIVSTLATLFEDSMAEEWVDLTTNPVRHPGVRKELPPNKTRAAKENVVVHFSADQADALLWCTDVPAIRRLRYLIALTGGLRDGEIAALRWSDLLLDAEVPHIDITQALSLDGPNGYATLGKTKTEGSVRKVPLHPRAIEALHGWKRAGWEAYVGHAPEPTDPVFANEEGAAHRPASAEFVRRDLQAGGQPTTCGRFPLDFHATRRTFATRLGAAGVEDSVIQKLMGHAGSSVTTRHYTAAVLETMKRAIDRLDVEPRRSARVSVAVATAAAVTSQAGGGDGGGGTEPATRVAGSSDVDAARGTGALVASTAEAATRTRVVRRGRRSASGSRVPGPTDLDSDRLQSVGQSVGNVEPSMRFELTTCGLRIRVSDGLEWAKIANYSLFMGCDPHSHLNIRRGQRYTGSVNDPTRGTRREAVAGAFRAAPDPRLAGATVRGAPTRAATRSSTVNAAPRHLVEAAP